MKVCKYLVILLIISFCFGCVFWFPSEDELPIEEWAVTGARYYRTYSNMSIDIDIDVDIEDYDIYSPWPFYWNFEDNFEGREQLNIIELTSLAGKSFSEASVYSSIYIRGIDPSLDSEIDTEILFDTETYFYREDYSPYGHHIVAKCRFITPSVTIEYFE